MRQQPTPTERNSPRLPRLGPAPLIAAVWLALGLFYFSQALLQKVLGHDPTPWWHSLVTWLTGVTIGALSTPIVLWLGHRFPLRRRGWFGVGLVHLAFSFGYGIAQITIESLLLPHFHVYPKLMTDSVRTFVFMFVLGFHPTVVTYWTILALQAGWDYYRRYLERRQEALRLELRASELQTELARAQLGALKAQLQPHFLFNTLNAIMTLVRQGHAAQAEQMLGRLADLLRCVLDDLDAQEIPLRRELDFLRLYLSIEEVRFADRLRVEITTEPGLLEALVPHLCLQPVVENAIRHGFGRSTGAGRITIRARREADALVLEVEDDGPGLAGATPGTGIGLANTRARLAQLYGEHASLAIADIAPHGVLATVRLPYRELEDTPGEAYVVHDTDRR